MPTVTPGSKILVTGANGFVAMWIIRKLFEKGYSVRATVRSDDKAKHVVDYFKAYSEKLEVVTVPDFLKEGAFDDVVKGVEGIAHVASPSPTKSKKVEEIVQVALDGSLGVLKSAQKFGTDVKRIVYTSSIVAMLQNSSTKVDTYSEKNWNDEVVQVLEEKGMETEVWDLYAASKTLAERAAWDFYHKNKETLTWDLTTLCLPWVFGPPIQELAPGAPLNDSLHIWWDILMSDGEKPLSLIEAVTPWADVRNCADAHLLSFEKEAAGGERIFILAEEFLWSEWVDAVNSLDADLIPNGKVRPLPKVDQIVERKYDGSKARKILPIKYLSKEETARAILEAVKGRA